MFYDIVFPENNEKEFIGIAEKLGTEGLCFVYQFSDKKSAEKVKDSLRQLQQATKIKLKAAFRASGVKIYKVHDMQETAVAEAPEDSRETIAKYQPDIVYNLELSARKDFAKTRNSGLDKATCQFASKNGTIVAFSFSAILNSANLPQLLGRIKQNIMLCKKYRVKTAIASLAPDPYDMRSPHDLKSFLLSLGMYTANAKESVESVSELIKTERFIY
jgi:RNase P/RNase MRP subunit p30